MKIKRLICMFAVLAFVLIVLPLNSSAVDAESEIVAPPIESYTYPITLDSPEWFSYTVLEKVEMLRIPEETLSRMTDEALVQAIVEYPYLVDLGLYGTIEDGVSVCRGYFSALDELLKRESGRNALAVSGFRAVESAAGKASADKEDTHSTFVMYQMQELVNYLCDDFVIDVRYDENTGAYTVTRESLRGAAIS